jgi:LPXTG-site transpeptidase (sortase) family protein
VTGCGVVLAILVGATPTSLTPEPAALAQVAWRGEEGVVAARIRMPRLAMDAPIVEADPPAVPDDAIAHFAGTDWPGGGSNIYLYGHARQGLFRALWDVRTGDEVDLDLTDGTVAAYRVVAIRPVVRWDDLTYLDRTPTEQLTLQTCVTYDVTAPRFVVLATPIQPAT